MAALPSLVLAGASLTALLMSSALQAGDPRPSGGPAAVVDNKRPVAAAPSSIGPDGRALPPGPGSNDGPGPRRPRSGRFRWPIDPQPAVVRAFAPGPFPWSPGHRGVDLAAVAGSPVVAIGAGTVTFAGSVAGRGVVVVQHDAQLRSTYQPLTPAIRPGRVVRAGDPLGLLSADGSHCQPANCLHLGAIADGEYVDPLLLIRGRQAPVLLPAPQPGPVVS